MAVALAISAILHVVVLGVRVEIPALPWDPVAPRTAAGRAVSVMQAFDIVPVEGDVTAPSPDIVPTPARDALRPDFAAPRSREEVGQTTGDTDRMPASVLERLAPRAGDRRLWALPSRTLKPSLDRLSVVRARIAGRLAPYNDSVAAEVEADHRAADWTQKDANGERWGISPARIHLGGVTLPLQLDTSEWVFAPPPGRRDEQNDRIRTFGETRLQVLRAEVERTLESRMRAIRLRNAVKRDTTRTSGG